MDIQKFVDIQMETLRNKDLSEQQDMIGKLIGELTRFGYTVQDAQIMIAQNTLDYMKKMAKELREEEDK